MVESRLLPTRRGKPDWPFEQEKPQGLENKLAEEPVKDVEPVESEAPAESAPPPPARAPEGPRAMEQEERPLEDTVVKIYRCSKVVKGGRQFGFTALTVVGDGNGKVGFGYGKAKRLSDAWLNQDIHGRDNSSSYG